MEKVQTMSEKTKKQNKTKQNKTKQMKLIYGNPPVHGVWRFSDPPVGPMEDAKNKKSEFFFDYGQNVF